MRGDASGRGPRLDERMIAEMIEPGSRVLDIGSGDGSLIEYLARARGCDARGIEIDMNEVARAVGRGLPVMHGDADHDLRHYRDGAFDYVVLSRTLQAVERPREVLHQMLRIGKHAIVSFPNFGHWELRWQLFRRGRMPMTTTWGRPWWETPNIHPCTILDFFTLAADEGCRIERWFAVDEAGRQAPWRRHLWLANLFGEQGVFLLCRAGGAPSENAVGMPGENAGGAPDGNAGEASIDNAGGARSDEVRGAAGTTTASEERAA